MEPEMANTALGEGAPGALPMAWVPVRRARGALVEPRQHGFTGTPGAMTSGAADTASGAADRASGATDTSSMATLCSGRTGVDSPAAVASGHRDAPPRTASPARCAPRHVRRRAPEPRAAAPVAAGLAPQRCTAVADGVGLPGACPPYG
jgi:hypothetical protein